MFSAEALGSQAQETEFEGKRCRPEASLHLQDEQGDHPSNRGGIMSTQTFGITMTFDPATGQLTPSPPSVTVGRNDSAEITVSLALAPGAQGSVIFDNPPLTWASSTGAPSGVSVNPSQGGTSQITITDPNTSPGTFNFSVNIVPPTADGAAPHPHPGDPTIINEGTGQS